MVMCSCKQIYLFLHSNEKSIELFHHWNKMATMSYELVGANEYVVVDTITYT